MYKILFKTDIKSIFRRKKKSKMPSWMSYLLIGAFCCASFYMMYYEMAVVMAPLFYGDMYFTMIGSTIFSLLFFTDVTLAQNQLFESKYNDMLLSMPITADDILISRILVMLCYNYFLELLFAVPGYIAWVIVYGFEPLVLVMLVVILLIWPLLAMTLGILVGYVLMRITARMKHKNLFRLILFVGFMVIYYFAVVIAPNKLQEIFIDSGIMEEGSSLSFINWFGKAVWLQDIPSIIKIVLLSIIPFAIVFHIVRRNFFKTISLSKDTVRIEYKEKELKTHSITFSLLYREWKRMFNCFVYLTNNFISVIMAYIGCVVLFVGWDKVWADVLPYVGTELAAVMALLTGLFVLSAYMVSASSISLEGQSLDALKTFPIDTVDIINSKILFHYLFMGPCAILFSFVLIIKGQLGLSMSLSALILPTAFLIFTDCLGLWLNLRHHKLDWANEAEVVKRGLPVFLVMLVGMGVIACGAAVYLLWAYKIMNYDVYLLICSGLITMAAIGFYLLDVTVGVKIFNRIS